MYLRFILFTCFIVITNLLSAQAPTQKSAVPFKHHSIYVELAGSSLVYSLNYDYSFTLSPSTKLAVGAGFGTLSISLNSANYTSQSTAISYFTPQANFLFGKNAHHFEMGISVMNFIFPAARVGYRYQRPQG